MALNFDDIHTEKKQTLLFKMMTEVCSQILSLGKEQSKLTACPICESKNVTDFVTVFGFNMSKCNSCWLIFCNPYPNDEQIGAYYNSEMKAFENEFFRESFENRVDLFGPRITLLETLNTEGKLLDIGSAIGVFVEALKRAQTSFEVTCCDLNEEACRDLKLRYPDTKIIHADAKNLIGEETYDIVTMWDTLEHIVDQNSMLTTIRELLNDNGYFVFSTPNTFSFEWLTAQEKHVQILPPGHVNLMNEKNIKLLLSKNDFEVQECHTLNPSLDITYVQKWFSEGKLTKNDLGNFLSEVISDESFTELLERYLLTKQMAGNILVIARKKIQKNKNMGFTTQKKITDYISKNNKKTHLLTQNHNKNELLNEGYSPKGNDALYIERATGSTLIDTDGNHLIDLGMAAGSALLGHSHPKIAQAISQQTQKGWAHLRTTIEANKFGQTLEKQFPFVDNFAFCNSGSEATMRAMRIGRAHTGKNKIAVFSGGWHGGQDWSLIAEDYSSQSDNPTFTPLSGGLINGLSDHLIMLPYNNDNAFDLLEKSADQIAMVIIEPVQGSTILGTIGPFLNKLRKTTSKLGILLCFDEVITGIRLNKSGSQYFDVIPDIITLGKIIGGGLPIGAVGVKKEIVETIKEGRNGNPPVFLGGTFSANPLTITAGQAALNAIDDLGQTLFDKLNSDSTSFRSQINKHCQRHSYSTQAIGVESMSRLIFTQQQVTNRRERDFAEKWFKDKQIFDLFCRANGLHIPSNGILFMSAAHTRNEVDTASQIICDGLDFVFKGKQ
ncbi:MAG: aminotransferase class III-fold pyridoxal phosphate-dependent enzyme [Rhodospirillales bacterium]|nr:aminotransferase class III-fold pyridoxal phosphate-dependent enzyme [Rhodospirillales bacterium]